MGELNQHNLSEFGCTQFVETGTGEGTGLYYASQFPFIKLYSIEIIDELARKVSDQLPADSNIEIYNNNSLDGLKEIIPKLTEEPTLFWLDAHFPGADFKFNDYHHLADKKYLHMPLAEEVATIMDLRDTSKDCFIIDDLRIYEEGPYELGSWDLYSQYGGGGLGFLDNLTKTHSLKRDYRQQGFIILTPKK